MSVNDGVIEPVEVGPQLKASSRTRWHRLSRSPYIHPAFFAAYPVVFLWSRNVAEHPSAADVLTAFAMMAGLGIATFVVLLAVTRDAARAGLGTSMVLVLFSIFGRVAFWVGAPHGSSLETALLVGWVLLGAAGVVLASRLGSRLESATVAFNAIAVVLVALNVLPLLAHRPQQTFPRPDSWAIQTSGFGTTNGQSRRDVYYLIFDRYAGEHTLHDLYGFDNEPFVSWLGDRGFSVIHDALANYPQTTHSLASSLNMNYLDGFANEVGLDSDDWGPLRSLLGGSTAAQTFQTLGYRYVHIGSWWRPTWSDPTADRNFTYGGLSEFAAAFRTTTAWSAVTNQLGLGADFDRQQWERVHFQVQALDQTSEDPDLTFTFAHLTLPHPPYVFHADGSYVAPDPTRPVEEAYLDQLRYTNQLIQQLVASLLDAPGPAPIIVLQSDEGPHPPTMESDFEVLHMDWAAAPQVELDRKLRILNAYYLPGDPVREPYPTITPVNTFRLILDDYFGADLPLLEDRTYIFTDFAHPYRFEDVTDRMRGG